MPARVASFTSLQTPIGRLWLAATDRGLRLITRADDPTGLIGELARHGWTADPDPVPVSGAVGQLQAYFAGRLRTFNLSLDLDGVPRFDAAVCLAAMQIPFGATMSYGELAGVAGSPRAARAVGGAMARCPLFPVVPCHRVIHADGSIGGWGRDLWVKRWLLRHERGR